VALSAIDSPAQPRAPIALVFCFLAALCEGYDVQAAGVAAAGIAAEFHATAGQLGLFFGAGGLGLALGAVIGGRLADRVGRKAVLVASIGSFGLFAMASTFAVDMTTLTCMRVLMGLGLGGAMPNLIALSADASRAGSRNASIATTYIGMPLGGTLASLVVVALAAEQWRSVFWIGGAAPLAIAITMALFMPVSARVDPVRDAGRPLQASRPASSFGRDLFSEGRLGSTLLLWIGFFLCVLTLHLMLNWLPLLLQGRGLSKTAAATAQAAFNVGGAMGGLLTGALLDTRRRALAIATNILILPAVLLLLAISHSSSGLMVALASLLGVAVLSLQVILYGVAGIVYTPAARGTGMGAAVGWGRMGSIAGPTFAALLVGAGRTPAQVLLGVLPIAVFCGIAVAILGRCHYRGDGLPSD
jgi:AAHS family 3-hydroxyphenylpropionic acid transporter